MPAFLSFWRLGAVITQRRTPPQVGTTRTDDLELGSSTGSEKSECGERESERGEHSASFVRKEDWRNDETRRLREKRKGLQSKCNGVSRSGSLRWFSLDPGLEAALGSVWSHFWNQR
jgi:hypothetical protein